VQPAGESIYQSACAACHTTGVLNAPKLGDRAAWQPRLAQGMATLYQHAINGIRGMPPKGGNTALSDAEVKAAVDYMATGKAK
jgi:cytochrome c5